MSGSKCVLIFQKAAKLYLYKDKSHVDLSIRVSDTCVQQYNFSVDEFEQLLAGWDSPHGIDLTVSNKRFNVLHKTRTPRPEGAATSYVKFTVYTNGMAFHHRLDYGDMQELQRDYYYQKHNHMHWDRD